MMLRNHVLPAIRCSWSYLAFVAFIWCAVNTISAQANDVKSITEHMVHLQPLIGAWNADYEFHKKDGTVDIVEPGTWRVSWVLDHTYLQVQTEHHRPHDPSHHWTYFTFITYDPVTAKYVSTFFYGRWSGRVTEEGIFDERSNELRTTGLVPLEDGKRDEHVRNIYRLIGGAVPTITHYSRYSDEPAERMDLLIRLHRPGAKRASGDIEHQDAAAVTRKIP